MLGHRVRSDRANLIVSINFTGVVPQQFLFTTQHCCQAFSEVPTWLNIEWPPHYNGLQARDSDSCAVSHAGGSRSASRTSTVPAHCWVVSMSCWVVLLKIRYTKPYLLYQIGPDEPTPLHSHHRHRASVVHIAAGVHARIHCGTRVGDEGTHPR